MNNEQNNKNIDFETKFRNFESKLLLFMFITDKNMILELMIYQPLPPPYPPP
jgi:hypothetical protein